MIDIQNNNNDQRIYDSFNDFMFSADRNVFNKLYSKIMFYDRTRYLMGDIVECGVFKGSGMMSWLKLIDVYDHNSIKKVIGFDFFDQSFVADLPNVSDMKGMEQVFSRCENLDKNDISYNGVMNKILASGFGLSKFKLIAGDISKSAAEYASISPGFRISILNLDLDLAIPTYDTLNALWDRIVPGGIVIFDEYGIHAWSESNGADKFAEENGLQIIPTGLNSPTAYIVKEY